MVKRLWANWYWLVVALYIIFVVGIFAVFGEDSYIAIHDNLDLFVAQYQMLKNTGSFFSHGDMAPFLGGITRDVLPSEWALSTWFYMVLPSFAAYVCNYLCKVGISIGSFYLLGREWLKEEFARFKGLVVLVGLAYGMIPVFPAYGIAFASVPLLLYLCMKLYGAENFRKAAPYLLCMFLYPLVSYFSYFGLFACGYLLLGILFLWIRDRKPNLFLVAGLVLLALGNVVFEYRLFGTMLFGTEETIRSTMAGSDFTLGQVWSQICSVFKDGIFHAEDLHGRFVFYIVIIYFFYLNMSLIWEKRFSQIWKEPFNLIMVWIVFNSVVYGFYDFAKVRQLVETLCPPLEGWQFNRTVFFNPFLWYAAFFIALKDWLRLVSQWKGKKLGGYALKSFIYGMALLSILFLFLTDTRYNDVYHTCYYQAVRILKHKEPDMMNYREFYGVSLFEQIKDDIGYEGEWAVAYGFHPAQLEYNGIATLDGYLGFYAQSYKEAFREVIAPALDRVEASRIYYDDWGARAYLYGGTDESIVSGYKSFTLVDQDIYINTEALKALGGTYIFSRYEITNATEASLVFCGVYEDNKVPYDVYLYQVK